MNQRALLGQCVFLSVCVGGGDCFGSFLPACWLSRGRKAQVVDGLELARTVPTRLDHARAARSGVGT